MASEDTLIGNDLVFQLGDDASPPNYEDMCAVYDFGSIGEEKPLVDVTALCDAARTYRNGLPDGSEIPLACNFLPDDPQLRELYRSYKDDEIRNFAIQQKDGSPGESFTFRATIRAWNVGAPIGERATFTFTLKVSGEVLWNEAEAA